MDRELTRALKEEALRLGFDRVGVAPAVAPATYPAFLELARGRSRRRHGVSVAKRRAPAHPARLQPGAESVVVVSLVYGAAAPPSNDPRLGKIARYARGADYHDHFWQRLDSLREWLQTRRPEANGRASATPHPC